MKHFFISFFSLSTVMVTAQVDIDKPINLTGADGDRKVTNLELPVDGTDAANKDYVDNSVSASGGGGSAKPEAMSDEGPSTLVFHAAVQYCENLDEDGHSDWRLPTLQEALYFSGSEANSNYFWTLSETPGLDFGTNQNLITVRLSDGKWRNGGAGTFFFPSRSVSASSLTNASWTTVLTFSALTSGNTIVPTNMTFTGSDGNCSGPHEYRLIYNIDGGGSITSQTFTASCYSTTFLNNISIPYSASATQYSSIQVQHRRVSGTQNGSCSLTISGFETNFDQRDGNPLYVRCVR